MLWHRTVPPHIVFSTNDGTRQDLPLQGRAHKIVLRRKILAAGRFTGRQTMFSTKSILQQRYYYIL